jgi:hypothetical protein
MVFGEERVFRGTDIEWRKKKNIFVLVSSRVFVNIDWGHWVVSVTY